MLIGKQPLTPDSVWVDEAFAALAEMLVVSSTMTSKYAPFDVDELDRILLKQYSYTPAVVIVAVIPGWLPVPSAIVAIEIPDSFFAKVQVASPVGNTRLFVVFDHLQLFAYVNEDTPALVSALTAISDWEGNLNTSILKVCPVIPPT
jgi:hypothetical protein